MELQGNQWPGSPKLLSGAKTPSFSFRVFTEIQKKIKIESR